MAWWPDDLNSFALENVKTFLMTIDRKDNYKQALEDSIMYGNTVIVKKVNEIRLDSEQMTVEEHGFILEACMAAADKLHNECSGKYWTLT